MDNTELKKYLLDFAEDAELHEINDDKMDIPSGTAENIKKAVQVIEWLEAINETQKKVCKLTDVANVQKTTDERDMFKKKYLESEIDATNLTGEIVTVSAENEDLKQEVKYLHDVIADYDDCCKKRACPNMEKLKEQNEALKRVLKSKIKVYTYRVYAEEHDGCVKIRLL